MSKSLPAGALLLAAVVVFPLTVARAQDSEPAPPLEAGRPGSYRTSFSERSPLSSLETFVLRFNGLKEQVLAQDPKAASYDINDETFEIHVPASYDGETPHGLFVWISPGPSAKVGKKKSLAALEEYGVIWIGANNSGNQRLLWDRVGLALDAAHNMKKLYKIDDTRVYIGGYSGGGRTASALAVLYPDVFHGGYFLFGCNFYRDVPARNSPGNTWTALFPQPPPRVFDLIRERNRYVFRTGEFDFNRVQTKVFAEQYRKDGFRHVTYQEIPRAEHRDALQGAWLRQGLKALESRD